MEQYSEPSLFDLQIDQPVQTYLGETARWAKFLAIIGFVIIGIITVIVVIAALATPGTQNTDSASKAGYAAGVILVAASAAVMFFPCIYLYHFAARMQSALRSNDQEQLLRSFRNLKSCFRFIGILTLIYLCLTVLTIAFNIFGRVGH